VELGVECQGIEGCGRFLEVLKECRDTEGCCCFVEVCEKGRGCFLEGSTHSIGCGCFVFIVFRVWRQTERRILSESIYRVVGAVCTVQAREDTS